MSLEDSTDSEIGTGLRLDYILTTVVSLGSLLCVLLAIRLVGHRFGPLELGRYSLTYRVVAFLQPPLLLGTAIGLTRFLAPLERRDRERIAATYLVSASLPVVVALAFVSIPFLLATRWIAQLVFGTVTGLSFVRVCMPLLLGSLLHSLAYALLRGLFRSRRANVLTLVNIGVAPLLSSAIARRADEVLLLTGCIWIASSLIAVIPLHGFLAREVAPVTERLLSFGLRRVPGEIMLFALLSIPPIVASHTRTLREAGFFAIGMSLLSGAGAVFVPISQVMLPHASRQFAQDRVSGSRRYVRTIFVRVSVLSIIGVTFVELFAPLIVRLYLGSDFQGAALALRLVALSVWPYALYVSLRSHIDAYHFRAINMRNASVAFASFLVMTVILDGLGVRSAAETGLAAGMTALGVLTVHEAFAISSSTRLSRI